MDYKQIADNLRATVRADWCDKIEQADNLLAALEDCLAGLNVAIERSEGDTFGVAHNSVMDAMDAAERAITSARGRK